MNEVRPISQSQSAPLALVSENLLSWLSGSAIVDASGMPKVAYHGTTAVFDSFDESYLGVKTGGPDAKQGFFSRKILMLRINSHGRMGRRPVI